jgi:3-oxoacyl-(acyl-carrier-protein) synthase
MPGLAHANECWHRMKNRIVITGVGPVTALGAGKDAAWRGLQAGPPPPAEVSQTIGGEEWESYPLFACPFLEPSATPFAEAGRAAAALGLSSRDLHLFLAAAKFALQDSTLTYPNPNNRIGLVVSHENPGFDEYTRKIWRAMEDDPKNGHSPLDQIKGLYAQVEGTGYATHSFVLLQQLTLLLQVHGPAFSVNNACSSGLYALEAGAQWLRAGHADAVVVICGDSPRLLTRYLWLKAAKACASDGVMRPFDLNRSGFVLGEGAGAIVIETLESAQRRSAPIYTEYVVGSFYSDAWKLSLPSVSPNFYYLALREALHRSDKQPAAIDLVVPHGAATPIQDRYEAEAITRVFGRNTPRPLITALKPYVGHTLAGSSLLELILTLIGLCHETVLPTLNWAAKDEKLGIEPVTQHTSCQVKNWVKTATGFGGFNAACVFTQPGAPI